SCRAGGRAGRAASRSAAPRRARAGGGRAARRCAGGEGPGGGRARGAVPGRVLHDGPRRRLTMLPGLADPTLDSQRTFRSVLEAVSRPGRIVDVAASVPPPAPLHPATAALCLTLLDVDTPLWLDDAAARPEVVEWLKFHCGMPVTTDPSSAVFALIADGSTLPALSTFNAGTAEHPERSATLIVQVRALIGGAGR